VTQQAVPARLRARQPQCAEEHLAAKGVEKEQIEACGLVVHGPDIAVSYDRFRNRIMFPIEDSRGRVIAFGGRAMSPDQPAKYLNSNDTELFHKGNVLYNFARARKAMGRDGTDHRVEGYMDVIALAQAGFDNGGGAARNGADGKPARTAVAHVGRAGAVLRRRPGRAARGVAPPTWRCPWSGRADAALRHAARRPGPRRPGARERPEAMNEVLDEARPLADLLWMRETGGGVFDTPERRAELEQAAARTGRPHSRRERAPPLCAGVPRAHAGLFGAPARRGRGTGKVAAGGAAGAERAAGWRFPKAWPVRPWSRQGGRHAAARGGYHGGAGQSSLPAGEHFEEVERIDWPAPNCARCLPCSSTPSRMTWRATPGIADAISRCRPRRGLERAVELVRRARLWPLLEGAAPDDARDAFRQALHLQRAAHFLNRELRAAESALASEPTDENYRHLVEIQSQLRACAGDGSAD
jgi:DNA primase